MDLNGICPSSIEQFFYSDGEAPNDPMRRVVRDELSLKARTRLLPEGAAEATPRSRNQSGKNSRTTQRPLLKL
jgi:hypothetical protein